jgi:hypothetical protein
MTATRAKGAPRFTLEIEAPANGRVGKATVHAIDADGRTRHTDKADLTDANEREKLAKRLAEKLGADKAKVLADLEAAWNERMDQRRRARKQAEAGSPEAAAVETVELLDAQPDEIHRPLCLVGGRAYAAAWLKVRRSCARSVKDGQVVEHEPPLVTVEDSLVIVRDDGQAFADGLPSARPLAELGLPVCLPSPPPPGRGWSGAGVKRYQAGERPDPADVFRRLVAVVDAFVDFDRSLADQRAMCELVALYVMATYFLDAFQVAGYLWPNGEAGSGKTTLLLVVTETAYLGQLILAGSSYPTLRDLADYGATLAFDDAEAVMDVKRTDPDKRTLLLAGNRRGATVAVKEVQGERWVTRHVSTFCPRLFSAIRLPDAVLGSRTVIIPVVRSGKPELTKRSPMAPECWPHERRRLVDDLWALGLAHLADLPEHDTQAARLARLSGRDLEPWRAVLAVAHWLDEDHGLAGLYDRTEGLSMAYQHERDEYEEHDATRVLFRALLHLTEGKAPDEPAHVRPAEIAEKMCTIATAEDLAEPDKPFMTARRVGWLMRRQRFRRGDPDVKGKTWEVTRAQVERGARACGVMPDEAQVGG